jgi:hypothetical protein
MFLHYLPFLLVFIDFALLIFKSGLPTTPQGFTTDRRGWRSQHTVIGGPSAPRLQGV